MTRPHSLLAALLMALSLGAPVAVAQEGGHATPEIKKQSWTFAGPFGTYDQNQLQRGFEIFQNTCAGCHSARLFAFRNLSEAGGPGYSEDQIKALAASMEVADPEVEGGTRPGIPADRWPSPFATEQDARDSNGGALPPDMSVLAKARSIATPFPWWILNYITAYSEGGPDYIYALLTGYEETPPEGVTLPEGKYYNHVFPGHAIGMSPPLDPATADQQARDVSAFLMWLAEPHLVERKEAGFRVILFLILFAGLMWFVKEKLWAPVHHHNPSPDEVTAQKRKTSA